MSSQQVVWEEVHAFIRPALEEVGSWPMLGTPAWCELTDDHPAKWAALLDAAQHWALRLESCQRQLAEASHDISAAEDWSGIAYEIYGRAAFYAERPWLKRKIS